MAAFADQSPVGLTHEDFELESTEQVGRVLDGRRFDVILNTAAFHVVDRCEAEPERALAINALAVERLAAACEVAGTVLAHVSTDYVFDGQAREPYIESDSTSPINTYGISKLTGELLLRRRPEPHYIFRTSGLYSPRGRSTKGKPFIERMLESAKAAVPLRVVNDVCFSPSNAAHVATAIRAVIEREAYGLYHVTNGGACTWHAFATEALKQAGIDARIEATSAADGASPIRRPAYSALAGKAMAELGLPAMPAWQEGVTAYLSARDEKG